MQGRVAALPSQGNSLDARRVHFLAAQLTAAATRLRMMKGEKLSFADEARGLFGIAPEIKPLSTYDPVIAKIETLVPGSGPLSERVEAFQNRFNIPTDRLKPVFDAAIAECKRRTLQHIALPKNESFTLEFVTGKSWSGYNYYKGNAHSLIQVNTDLPIRISRAVDLGCHEGYPGHHVLNALLEEKLTKGTRLDRVQRLSALFAAIADRRGLGQLRHRPRLPRRRPARVRDRDALSAGRPADRRRRQISALTKAMQDLAGARFTIARDYLEGRISRAEAVRLSQKYQLLSKERAEKSLDFTDQYRSYVINYGLGQDMVRAYVEAAGPDPKARWARMEKILSEPTLPSDLKP